VHLVHPLGLHWDTRRVKNDVKDATELAKRLWRKDLPEAWVAPPEVRDLRELVRHRAKQALEWYGRLGYTQEWEYRAEPEFPAFVSVARNGGSRIFSLNTPAMPNRMAWCACG
jgi:hypothetical protein